MFFGHLPEILILLFLALLVFGPKKMIEMGSSVGRMFRELRDATREMNWSNMLSGNEDSSQKNPFSQTPFTTGASSGASSQPFQSAAERAAGDGARASAAASSPASSPTIVESTIEHPAEQPIKQPIKQPQEPRAD